jgi:hypothetical protein
LLKFSLLKYKLKLYGLEPLTLIADLTNKPKKFKDSSELETTAEEDGYQIKK